MRETAALERQRARGRQLSARQWTMIAAPLVLIPTMVISFRGFTLLFGHPLGYLLAFLVYWFGWCLGLPALVLGGPHGILELFHRGDTPFTRLGWKMQLVLWWPIGFP